MLPSTPGAQTTRSFAEPLSRLPVYALDMHWSWNHAGDAVWKLIDRTLWERTQNPWLLLQYVSNDKLEQLATDPEFLQALQELERARALYRETPPWRPPGVSNLPRVAYFSMEFGLHEALPLYAGGLGVLAGDYLKTASDLDVPLVGVGVLWQQGYFRQVLDADGSQTELYPFNDPASLPVQPVLGPQGERLRVELRLPGRDILLRAWEVTVGRTKLYLLDSNDPLNAPADRGLTSALYGGDSEMRLMQEIILGVGGWRLLEALGCEVQICHLNEGHAAFVVVERARSFMERQGVTFREALWATRAGNVFTTHTAVPAGFDAFKIDEIEKYRTYFGEYVQRLGVSWSELLDLGRIAADDGEVTFSMAHLAVRGCSRINGVSRLHGAVSRRLFAPLFPRWPEAEVPVHHITNGVHVPSWDSPWTDALWTRAAGRARWRGDVSALAEAMSSQSDEDLWTVRAREREDLIRYSRERLARQLARRGTLESAAHLTQQVLQPDALTLGFARRFAAYKRPNLLLSDPDRLLRLLTEPRRPVQIIVAGKAHPRDRESKKLIEKWVHFATSPEARPHVVFLEDYDMRLATELVQGVDVWINTPRRPWEASGTSGMKVLVNGGLNLSVLDGWWAEAFKPCCGWGLEDRSVQAPADEDRRDADRLYSLLESEIVPAFYSRDASNLPREWIARMRSSMATLAPQFSSARMLQEYVEQAYIPSAALLHRRTADGGRLARELDRWSRHLSAHWTDVRIAEAHVSAKDGGLLATATVSLGAISAEDVQVHVYADPDDDGTPIVQEMTRTEPIPNAGNCFAYRASVISTRPPAHFTVRVVPFHPDAMVPIESSLIVWQR